MLAYELINIRPGGEYSVAGCDVVLGFKNDADEFVGVLTVRNVWLREKRDGGGHFISWPSAARVKGGTVVKEDGKAVYDNLVGLFGFVGANPKKASDWAVAGPAWDFQKQLVEDLLVTAKATAKVESGRGTAKPAGRPTVNVKKSAVAGAARPAKAAPVVEEELDGDDDLPF